MLAILDCQAGKMYNLIYIVFLRNIVFSIKDNWIVVVLDICEYYIPKIQTKVCI